MIWLLTQHVLTVAILVVVVVAICRWGRLNAAAKHLLWLLVVIKFMTPPVVTWPWPVNVPAVAEVGQIPRQKVQPVASHTTQASERADVASSDAISNDRPLDRFAVAGDAELSGDRRSEIGTTVPASGSLSWQAVLLCLWGGCSLVVAVRYGWRILRTGRHVSRGGSPPAWLVEQVDRSSSRLGVRAPETVVCDDVRSPFLWCWPAVRLVWPAGLTGNAGLPGWRAVIAHEMAHLCRRDHWVVWLELFAGIVWCWNPLWWYTRTAPRT